MWIEDGHRADWKDAGAYAPLLGADRSVFAWEWLRRDERYRAAAIRALVEDREISRGDGVCHPGAARWGLHAFEWPYRPGPTARPVWMSDVHPYVLAVTAHAATAAADAFRLDRLADRATILCGADRREHVLLSDGLRTIRVDVIEGSVAGGPVDLRYQLHGIETAQNPLLSLRRLLALSCGGHFPKTLYPPEARARRWLLLLRAFDALEAGADQREIAARLLSADSLRPRWRSDVPSLRSRAQRLVRGARAMAADYRWMLR